VVEVHLVVGTSLLLLNLAVGVWGVLVLRGRLQAGRAFQQALALSHTIVFGQALLGLTLLSGRYRAPVQLHYVYGLLPSAMVVFAYSSRTDSPRRNLLVFTIVALLIAGLATRAWTTGRG
jgi:hypothetical protein